MGKPDLVGYLTIGLERATPFTCATPPPSQNTASGPDLACAVISYPLHLACALFDSQESSATMVKHNNIIPNQHFHKKWAIDLM